MCAVWLKLITILSLSCTTLGSSGSNRVEWRDFGGAVTIHCKSPTQDQEYLELKKGLLKERNILFKERDSKKLSAPDEYRDRVKLNGTFSDLDIHINNLTHDDTGLYWCIYMRFDMRIAESKNVTGGSMLLVVKDKMQQCDVNSNLSNNNNNLLNVVIVVICALLLLGLLSTITWWISKNIKCSTWKPRPVGTNDVYEDMRGTIRR